MKKLLLIGALLTVGISAYSKEVVSAPVETVEPVVVAPVVVPVNPWVLSLRGGSDVIWSEYDPDNSDRAGWEAGLEISKFMDPHWSLGLGALYQSFGKEDNGGDYDSIPVYLTAKYYFSDVYEGVRPYIKGNIGYAFNTDPSDRFGYDTSVDDGMYWAAGAGLEYNNWFMDIMYQNTAADMKARGFDLGQNNDYSRVTLGLGYNFNF